MAYFIDLFKRKKSFRVAIEAFMQGKTIYRLGENKKYTHREIKCRDAFKIEHGHMTKGEFNAEIAFPLEDVIADDWIIEE